MGSRFNRSQKKDSVVKDDTKMAITMATAHQAGYYAHLILNLEKYVAAAYRATTTSTTTTTNLVKQQPTAAACYGWQLHASLSST